MNIEDLLKKIKRIEIKTKGLTKHIFSGEYHSSFKGKGMTFSEVRDYQVGDDVRTIDWNVTARFNSPFIKVFEEERELTVMLLIDVSDSTLFGSQNKLKKELILELAAVIAFSAEANNDKVGAIFLSDRIEKYIQPAKGKKHILFLLRELIEFEPVSKKTDLNEGLRFFGNVLKKRSIGFVISDFISESSFIESFKIIRRKHDLIALKVSDPAEYAVPDIGIVQLFNAETGITTWVDTSSKWFRHQYQSDATKQEENMKVLFQKNGIDYALFSTSEDYIPILTKLLHRRK